MKNTLPRAAPTQLSINQPPPQIREYYEVSEREGFIIGMRSDKRNEFLYIFESRELLEKNIHVPIIMTCWESMNAFLAGVKYQREKEQQNAK